MKYQTQIEYTYNTTKQNTHTPLIFSTVYSISYGQSIKDYDDIYIYTYIYPNSGVIMRYHQFRSLENSYLRMTTINLTSTEGMFVYICISAPISIIIISCCIIYNANLVHDDSFLDKVYRLYFLAGVFRYLYIIVPLTIMEMIKEEWKLTNIN